MKPAIRSASAKADIEAALEFYIAEAPHVADGFITALEKAAAQIERQPGIGSPRYGQELSIPGLRHWRLNRFPYALFYIEHDDHLDFIRLVHMSRDIPASLQAQT
ncbi:MAG: type II toxin-antitoxin system RelE/ParE family toxin [Ramlibacter sp.]